MTYRRILTVQDISCLGQCSMTVALPILSACGHETCILPTAVLSTHTGGFGAVYKKDMTQDLPEIIAHWKRAELSFDAICTGYLGSAAQIDVVRELLRTMRAPGGIAVVDPAMADHGKLYSGFDQAYVDQMKKLCSDADVIIPNLTEACMLTDTPYCGKPDEVFVHALITRLGEICPCVILTGIGFSEGETGVMIFDHGKLWHYAHPKAAQSYHGTGDIFAAAFVGAWQQDNSLEKAVQIAADFTVACIQKTAAAPAHWYGVKFEQSLPELMAMLREDISFST